MSEYTLGRQPCDKFHPMPNEHGTYDRHICPECGELRVFCENCCRDHHENGWAECWKLKNDADLCGRLAKGDPEGE